MDLSSVESVLAGIARIVSAELAALAIREAARVAFEEAQLARDAGSTLKGATQAGAGAGFSALFSNPLGIAALIASLGLSAISVFRSRQRSAQEARSRALAQTRTFHDPTNDALVEMAVNRALVGTGQGMSQTMRNNNRQQARDVADAVDAGIRGSDTSGTPLEVTINVDVPLTDQLVETITYKQRVLARRGQ